MESGENPGESVTVKSAFCGISQIHGDVRNVSAETVKHVFNVCSNFGAGGFCLLNHWAETPILFDILTCVSESEISKLLKSG